MGFVWHIVHVPVVVHLESVHVMCGVFLEGKGGMVNRHFGADCAIEGSVAPVVWHFADCAGAWRSGRWWMHLHSQLCSDPSMGDGDQ